MRDEQVLYTPHPNLLLEALTYLGIRANQSGIQELEGRLRGKGVTDFT